MNSPMSTSARPIGSSQSLIRGHAPYPGHRHRSSRLDQCTKHRTGLTLAVLVIAGMLVAVSPADAHTLSYRAARKAAQREADRFAGQRTRIESLLRTSVHGYRARAAWHYVDPTGCKGCGYDEQTGAQFDTPLNESCDVVVLVRYRNHRSRRPAAYVDEHLCV